MSAARCWAVAPPMPHMPCHDCGKQSQPYMLRTSVWRRAGGKPWIPCKDWVHRQARRPKERTVRGVRFLCIACLQSRLGRDVRASDFLQRPRWNCWLDDGCKGAERMHPVMAWAQIHWRGVLQ